MLIYLFLINLLAFVLMRVDKTKAQHGRRRIPEKILFLSAIAGGCVGVTAGMLVCRHKTKHTSFVIGLPVILLLQLTAALWLTC